ncbi:MAG: hypothetical protein GY801_11450 [bacterium]|nr:hypothetical protein [bacterium]
MEIWGRRGSLLLLFCVLAGALGLPAYAQGSSDLDAVLEGFDDQEEPSGGDGSSPHEERDRLDDVLNGFDEQEMSQEEENNSELEDILKEFDTPNEQQLNERSGTEKAPFWDLFGYWKFLTVMNVNERHEQPFQGLTHLRGEVDVKLELDVPDTWKARIGGNFRHDVVYLLKGRDEYAEELVENDETEIELREAYLQGKLSQKLDLKFGRQIVVWGVSDSWRVVDVLNPLDLREIGMVDIEDLRLPVTMTRLDYYPASRWALTGIMIHEIRSHKEPSFGSDFYPGTAALPDEEAIPDFSLAHQEFALAAIGRFSGWDLSLHTAWVYDDNWYLKEIPEDTVQRQHSRLFIGGLTGQITRGNVLFKGEAALIDGLKFSSLPDKETSRLDLLLGLAYSGFHDTSLSLDVVNRHLFEYDDVLSSEDIQRNQFQSAFRFTRDFYHDTMHVMLLASVLGVRGEDGALERVQLEYEWAEALSIFLGATLYQGGDTEFSKAVQDNDRLFFEFKYSF